MSTPLCVHLAYEGVERMEVNEQSRVSAGARLRRARDERGLSQSAVAHAVGCSPGAVWRWEGDRSVPQTRFRAALADVLSVERSELGEWLGLEESGNVFYIRDPQPPGPHDADGPVGGSFRGPVTEAERAFFDAVLAGVRDGHASRRRWNRAVENAAAWLGIAWERADPNAGDS